MVCTKIITFINPVSVKSPYFLFKVQSITLFLMVIVADSFSKGRVILIFSVNNCHGYHGYASLTSAPNPQAEELDLAADGNYNKSRIHL